ncbi:DsbA family oxidoreductase [Streptomyces sp. NPDC014894]|uniref:DsbA family oxidoreductase n=1 Tax=unclassified Streptomyces TaxID=2593676 RepID=UPI0036FC599E
MRVEVFFDVLCPWSYIGKRRLAAALADRDDLEIVWRSFELDPDGSPVPGDTAADVIIQYRGDTGAARVAQIQELGRADGLELNLYKARPVNSFDSHRLMQLAATRDLSEPLLERLLKGYHTEGLNIADHQVLETLAVEAGLDAAEVRGVLGGDAFAAEVRSDERRAVHLNVRGVPTMVIGGGHPVSAVQTPADLVRIVDQASRAAG